MIYVNIVDFPFWFKSAQINITHINTSLFNFIYSNVPKIFILINNVVKIPVEGAVGLEVLWGDDSYPSKIPEKIDL